MGYHFDGLDPKTGAETRFYFSLRDMQVGLAENPDSDFDHKHLSLGTTIEDWYNETSELTETLYDALIDDALEIFATKDVRHWSHRRVEILVGHVCHGLAQRLARSRKQLETVPAGVQPIMQEPELSREVDLPLPMSTSEAMDLLMSDHFGQVVDRLVSDHYFELQSTWIIRCTPKNAAPSISPTPTLALAIRKLYLITQKLIASRSRNFHISIASSYLGKIGTIIIGFPIRQLPLLLELRPRDELVGNSSIREVTVGEDLSLRGISKSLLHALIPSGLLDHFDALLRQSLDMGYPQSPKVIFTSNAFFYDDLFKVHVATNIPASLYIVGQHGNNYGVSRLSDLNPEIRTADYFLSWGWRGEKVINFGQIKPKVRTPFPNKVRGVTLFLGGDKPSPFADMQGPHDEYFRSVAILCAELDRLEIDTEIRFDTSTSRIRREFLCREISSFSHITIAKTRPSLARLLKSRRAAVFTYDSTGMLELASVGLPFFAFLQEGLGLIRQEFKNNYRHLEKAGLLSDDPVRAAMLIASWVRATPDIRKVQKGAVRSFSEGIVFYPASKLRSLSHLLLHASADGELSNWTEI
jgi:hypothetical protein